MTDVGKASPTPNMVFAYKGEVFGRVIVIYEDATGLIFKEPSKEELLTINSISTVSTPQETPRTPRKKHQDTDTSDLFEP